MSSTMRGATFDTYFVIDGRSTSLRDLWNRGMIEPGERLIGEPSVTIYTATFTDRPKVLQISAETYAVMIGERTSDADQSRELSDAEYERVYASATPEKQEAQEIYRWAVIPDPISDYDLPVL